MTPSPKAQAPSKDPKPLSPSTATISACITSSSAGFLASLPCLGGAKDESNEPGWHEYYISVSLIYHLHRFIFSVSSTSTNNRSQAAPASQLGQLLVQNGSTNARPMVKGMTIANIMVDKENWSWFLILFLLSCLFLIVPIPESWPVWLVQGRLKLGRRYFFNRCNKFFSSVER